MSGAGGPTRRVNAAVAGVSGGGLAMIWSAVWYAAIASGRAEASAWTLNACRVLFVVGCVAATTGFFYLRTNRRSVFDGSHVHAALPPDPELTARPGDRPGRTNS